MEIQTEKWKGSNEVRMRDVKKDGGTENKWKEGRKEWMW